MSYRAETGFPAGGERFPGCGISIEENEVGQRSYTHAQFIMSGGLAERATLTGLLIHFSRYVLISLEGSYSERRNGCRFFLVNPFPVRLAVSGVTDWLWVTLRALYYS